MKSHSVEMLLCMLLLLSLLYLYLYKLFKPLAINLAISTSFITFVIYSLFLLNHGICQRISVNLFALGFPTIQLKLMTNNSNLQLHQGSCKLHSTEVECFIQGYILYKKRAITSIGFLYFSLP